MSLELTPYDRLYHFVPVGPPNYALLREAREMLASIPTRQFDLSQIVTERGAGAFGSIAADGDLSAGCGTIACAAGWLALTPRFQALGLTASCCSYGGNADYCLDYRGVSTESQSDYDLAMAPLFNLTFKQAEHLFATRDEGDCEEDPDENLTDKALFLARIDRLLAAETVAE